MRVEYLATRDAKDWGCCLFAQIQGHIIETKIFIFKPHSFQNAYHCQDKKGKLCLLLLPDDKIFLFLQGFYWM